jgi:hypothetical protein
MLAKRTAEAGFELKERLAIYPEFARRAEFVDEHVRPFLSRHLDAGFYARAS